MDLSTDRLRNERMTKSINERIRLCRLSGVICCVRVLLRAQRHVASEDAVKYLVQRFCYAEPLEERTWIDIRQLFLDLFLSASSVCAYILLQLSDHSARKDAASDNHVINFARHGYIEEGFIAHRGLAEIQ
jgi:hypothetical protein